MRDSNLPAQPHRQECVSAPWSPWPRPAPGASASSAACAAAARHVARRALRARAPSRQHRRWRQHSSLLSTLSEFIVYIGIRSYSYFSTGTENYWDTVSLFVVYWVVFSYHGGCRQFDNEYGINQNCMFRQLRTQSASIEHLLFWSIRWIKYTEP